ncbi:MAG: helix-turn-helix domain-containing protein [Chloroflexota bacterium]|nr:helix-turn-helix domain-containing protein [Chloroflexota bacterium]
MTSLTDIERTEAIARFRVLRPYLEDGVSLAEIARNQAVTSRTLERWVVRYRSEGLVGLARRRRTDSGSHHLPDRLRLLIEGLAHRSQVKPLAVLSSSNSRPVAAQILAYDGC